MIKGDFNANVGNGEEIVLLNSLFGPVYQKHTLIHSRRSITQKSSRDDTIFIESNQK